MHNARRHWIHRILRAVNEPSSTVQEYKLPLLCSLAMPGVWSFRRLTLKLPLSMGCIACSQVSADAFHDPELASVLCAGGVHGIARFAQEQIALHGKDDTFIVNDMGRLCYLHQVRPQFTAANLVL